MRPGRFNACCLRIGLLLAAASATALPAQTSEKEVVALARGLADDATKVKARRALLEMARQRTHVHDELATRTLARMVVNRRLDAETSIRVLGLLGELGPLALDSVPILEEGFASLSVEVWCAALVALGKTAPYGGAGRLNTAWLLEAIFQRLGDDPAARHRDVLEAWVRLDERSRYYPAGSTAALLGKVSRGWGHGLAIVVEELGRRGERAALGPLRDYLERGRNQMPEVMASVRDVRLRVPFRDAEMMVAAEAMVRIDAEHPDSLVAHAVLLKHPDPMVRQQSLQAFGTLWPSSADAVPFLKMNLFDAPRGVIADSCTALGMIGPDARGAILALEQLSEHDDRQIAARAAAALRRVR